jgi:hypothetical protein
LVGQSNIFIVTAHIGFLLLRLQKRLLSLVVARKEKKRKEKKRKE